MSVVIAENVYKSYLVGEISVEALKGLNFTIEPASFVSFIGPSGSGKTTLLNLIGCLDSPNSGNLTVVGTNVSISADGKQPLFEVIILDLSFKILT